MVVSETRSIKIDLLQSEPLPPGYGIAWRRYETDTAVCYPIPLNILLGWLRAAWFWMRTGAWVKRWDNALSEAYWRGRCDGKQAVFDEIERRAAQDRMMSRLKS